jgi:ADP-heptose:LPS heptosyltransferase
VAALGTIRPQAPAEGGDCAGVDIAEALARATAREVCDGPPAHHPAEHIPDPGAPHTGSGVTSEHASVPLPRPQHAPAPANPADPAPRLRPVSALGDHDRVHRIAVLRALPAIGDMICAVPALRTLRARYPDARIGLVGLWSCRWMLDAYPHYVDELLPVDGLPLLCPPPADVEGALDALAEARRQGFDLAIQLHGDGSLSNLVTTMIGARRCLVHHLPDQPAPEGALAVPYPDRGHEVVRLLELVDRLGVVGEAHLEAPDPAARAAGAAMVSEMATQPEGFAVLHPGAADPHRRWPVAGFAAVASYLLDHDIPVVVTGTEAERDLVDELLHREAAVVDLCGRTGVNDLAGVLASARLVVSNDTGVAHLAAAVRAPSVVTFLGDDPGRWAPLDSVRHQLVPLTHVPEGPAGTLADGRHVDYPPPGAPAPDLLRAELASVIGAVADQLARFGPEAPR